MCERVYGDDSGPRDVDSYPDLVAFVLRWVGGRGGQAARLVCGLGARLV